MAERLEIDEEKSVGFHGSFVDIIDAWGMSVMLLPEDARKIARWILDNTDEEN